MAKRDFYATLGVERDADDKTIKTSYRKLAHQFHPDKNPNDPEAERRFREATEAYDVLSDENKRRHYDRFGVPDDAAYSAGFGFASGSVGDIFGDIFSDIFGGKTRTRTKEPGRDLRYNLELSFEEAAFGCERQLVIPRWRACGTCVGTGAKPGTTPQFCQACGGTGEVRVQQGFFSVAKTCGYCRGRGRVVRDVCTTCTGQGRERVENPLTVRVPPGADDNTTLKYAAEGEASTSGGPPGDLRVVLSIKPHPLFSREGDDITCRLPLSFAQAALGTSLEVPTLGGRVKMKVPAGTQSGRVFRLKGKGLAAKDGRANKGDQLVTVHVEVPTELTEKQRALLEQFDAATGQDSHPEGKNFWDKVRELFTP